MFSNSEVAHFPERRLKPRIRYDCPARLEGYDLTGKKFEETGRVVNLSRSGVYVLLNREISNGLNISIRIAMPTGILKLGTAKLAIKGTVVRAEFLSETLFGIAIRFENFKFV